jgi:hypothetical protein
MIELNPIKAIARPREVQDPPTLASHANKFPDKDLPGFNFPHITELDAADARFNQQQNDLRDRGEHFTAHIQEKRTRNGFWQPYSFTPDGLMPTGHDQGSIDGQTRFAQAVDGLFGANTETEQKIFERTK